MPHPVPLPCPHPSRGASPSAGALGQVTPSGWVQWPRLQPLPLATGLAPVYPKFQVAAARVPQPETLSAAPATVLPRHATLGCAVSRSAPSSELIPLLGRKEEPRDREGTKAVVWASSRSRSPLREGDGSQSGRQQARAARLGLGSPRVFCLLGRHGSKAVCSGRPLLRHCGALPLAAW